MAIDLSDGYNDLRHHIGHELVCVGYGGGMNDEGAWNVAIECVECGMVLIDFDHPDSDQA